MSTAYFSHCWGVFEGGGVRAAAHAGAYHAARAAGVTFGRVAGTSGGSIVAALIAAGAQPSELFRALLDTPMSAFLAQADGQATIFEERQWMKRLIRHFTRGNVRKFIDVSIDSGLHSSAPIETWVEEQLQALVGQQRAPGVTGPIQFQELRLPLHVVATDLATGRPKVWSRETTPEDSVAHAVRCSCTIPFFYQAIGSPQSVLVDGGAVSNLPSFVFAKMLGSSEGRSVLSRVLSFRLVSDPSQLRKVRNLEDFALRLSGAVIDAGTHIQAVLQPQVYDIAIRTGTVHSTDFQSVGKRQKLSLYRSGRSAVRTFIAHERGIVRESNSLPVYRGFDEKMLLLVQALQSCQSVFIAVTESTHWVNFVFPTLLAAARRGVQIVCITPQTKGLEEERRLWVLRNLGAETVQRRGANVLPFDGFLFDVQEDSATAILSTYDHAGKGDWYTREAIRTYDRSSDQAILQMLAERVEDLWTSKPRSPRDLPYVLCDESELFERLSRVPQYAGARIERRQLQLSDDIVVLQNAVKEYKFLQIRHHIENLQTFGCELFDLRKVKLLNGDTSIVTPPVLEKFGTKYVVIEGSARLFHCVANGVTAISAVVVNGVLAKLPSPIQRPLSSLRLTSSTKSLTENYQQLDRSLFRQIENTVHPYS